MVYKIKNSSDDISNMVSILRSDLWDKITVQCYRRIYTEIHNELHNNTSTYNQIKGIINYEIWY